MINRNRLQLSQIALCVAIAVGSVTVYAQNTTSAVAGRVTATDGKSVSGAVVKIVHVESGSTTNATTDGDGRYSARGLRVGGPYTITITKDGKTETRNNVFLTLAETATLDATLGASPKPESIEVSATAVSDLFSKNAMGAGTNIGRAEIEALGSIRRNLQDYARTDPRLSQTDKERGEISAGGQNTRFNSITIDGVNISDTFGLEANTLPTIKQPISIDAIQSVQVNISNYDVTQKGYTGANINAVTKSGTNDLKGSVYQVYRDQKLAGDRFNRTDGSYSAPPKFDETTKGITLGGPILKNKLFFFLSYEDFQRSLTAPDFGPLGSGNTNVGITASAISGAQSIANTTYRVDIGNSDIPVGSKLTVKDALVKLDWNINDSHRANVRYNKTEQSEPTFANLGIRSLSLNSHWWTQNKTIETYVGQWFADWTPNFSTEFKISKRDYDSVPANASNLPQIALNFTGALPVGTPTTVATGTRGLLFGTEFSRQTNVLQTKTTDAYFGGTWFLKEHEFKFGGDFSENKVYNAFLQGTKGSYTFSCQNSTATYTYSFGAINCGTAAADAIQAAVLENFRIGRPSAYQVQVPRAGKTLDDGIAVWSLKNLGGFIQDTWTVNKNLTVMAGVRLDVPKTNSKPAFNSAAAAPAGPLVAGRPGITVPGAQSASGGFGLDNSVTIDGEDLFQPRVGFNYTFDSKRPMQLRGGFGLFQGAAANVWLSNPYSNTGNATAIIGCGIAGFSACPVTSGTFSPNPATQPTAFTGAIPAANVDFIQKGLGQPAVWKANLAFEHQLPWWGMVASAEYIYTKVESGLYYQHLNLGAPTRTGTDGRQLFYTASGFNPACWTSGGVNTGACTDFRSRALNNPNYNNVTLATKTKKGEGNQATIALSRPMRAGWAWTLAYTYTNATEVSPLTSSVANSNFNSRSIFNPNEEVAARSPYTNRDRINASMMWQRAFVGKYKTTAGFFAEGRKGKPYSWTYTNDLNGDGVSGNDLMYIPKAPGSGDVVFLGDTATSRTNEDAFWTIVNANKGIDTRGGVVSRNNSFSPWTNSLDARFSQELPGFVKEHKAVVTLDLFNVANLLNKKWGRVDEIAFSAGGGQARSFVNYVGLDAQGRYIYSVSQVARDFVTRQANGESQWSAQVTFRYEF
ncbi:MAG: TonB-dependent receptor [Aeromicrobium sp.]|nr:TonB-dependent receptor [Burkholderiales bacterium]